MYGIHFHSLSNRVWTWWWILQRGLNLQNANYGGMSQHLGYVSRSGSAVHWAMAPQMHCIPAVCSISELIFHVLPKLLHPYLIVMGKYSLSFSVILLAFESTPSKTNCHLPTVHSFPVKKQQKNSVCVRRCLLKKYIMWITQLPSWEDTLLMQKCMLTLLNTITSHSILSGKASQC